MKRLKWSLIALAIIGLSGLSWVGVARAQSFAANVQKDKVIDSSIYAASQNVNIDGTVNGDVHCAGQTVTINGTVNGDVLCAGQTIEINGVVTGSVRAIGQDVTISAKIGHSATLAAQRVVFKKDASVKRDITVTGNEVTLDGTVGRDAVMAGGVTKVNAKIGRNLRYNGSGLQLKDAAVVGGGLTYTSDQAVDKANGAQINGATNHLTSQKSSHWMGMNVIEVLGLFLALLLFSMALVFLFPKAIHEVSGIAVTSLGKSVLIGFAAIFAVPLLIIVLASTIIGIPLALLVALAGVAIMMFSGPVAAYYLGSMLLSKSKNPVHMMLLGSTVLLLLYFVPIVGIMVMFVAYLIGSGALLIAIKRNLPRPEYQVK